MRFSFSTGNRTCNITLRRFHLTIVAVKKQKSTTYSERELVALGIQHAMRMRGVIRGLSAVAYPAVQQFLTLSHKRYNFREKSH